MDYRSPARLGPVLAAALLLASTAHAAQMQAGDVANDAPVIPSTALISARDFIPLESNAGVSDLSTSSSWSMVAFGPGDGAPREPVAVPRAIYGGMFLGDAAIRSVVDAGPNTSPVPLPASAWLLASALLLAFLPRLRRPHSALPCGGGKA